MDTLTYLYIILAAIVSLAIAAFQYFYKVKNRSKTNIILSFLRFLTIFSLLLLLLNIQVEQKQLEIIKPKLIVAIDNSSSIKYLNQDTSVKSAINSIKENDALNEKFTIDFFSFTDEIKKHDSLTFSDNETNISKSLNGLKSLYKDAHILLLTDGNYTSGSDYSYFKSENKVFPIAIGDTVAQIDLKLTNLNVNRYSFLNNTYPVELFVNYNGEQPINTTVTVQKDNATVLKKTVALSKMINSKKITFNLSANNVGIHNYTVSASKISSEENTVNNKKSFSVEVIDEQAKVAIVSDITHPDIGALKRSIETNKQRSVTILKSEDKLKVNDYQLFILYQPNNKFKSIIETIEKSNNNFFYITGSATDWSFLNHSQNYFIKTTINQTEEYFPVKNTSYSAFLIDGLNFDNLPPLDATFGDVKFNIASQILLFQSINGIQTEKSLLTTFLNDSNRRGALLTGEGIWKWRIHTSFNESSFFEFDSFINKLIQYLSSKKVSNRLTLEYEPIVYKNDVINIKANYFDNNYELDYRSELELSVQNNQTKEIKKYPFRLTSNNYITTLANLDEGDYSFTVNVIGQNVKKHGAFKVLDYNIEQQFTHANSELLKNLATNSNGEFFHISNYNSLIAKLQGNQTIKPVQKSTLKQTSLLDWKWLLSLIVLFLSSEWLIRKYFGKI